jgi:hypothetical protein
MVSKNMANILAQYRGNVSNIMQNTARPTYDMSKITPLATGNWVKSYNPNTSNAATKAALTTIKNNAWADAGQGILHGLGTALDIIDRPRNAIDSALSVATSKKSHNLGDILNSGIQGLTGQKHTSFGDLMDQWGWHKAGNWSIKDPLDISHGGRALVGFLGDVATDPLTYLSFGTEGVAKNALKPLVAEGEKLAAQQGFKKGTAQFTQAVESHLASNNADNILKAATAKNNKSLVNFGVPFGSKATIVPKPSFLAPQTQQISREAAQALAAKMSHTGMDSAGRYELLSHILGRPIHSTKDLNTQEHDFINQIWHGGLSSAVEGHYHPNNLPDPFTGVSMPKGKGIKKADWENFVNTHYQNVTGQSLPVPTSQMSVADLKNVATQLNTHLTAQEAQIQRQALTGALQNSKNSFNQLGKQFVHHDGLTGVSPLAKKLFTKADGSATKLGEMQNSIGSLLGSRRFVSVANQVKDHRVKDALAHVVSTNTKAYAYTHNFIQQLREIGKTPEFKSLSPDDWKEVAYTIEGQRPTHAGYIPPNPTKQAQIDHVVHLLTNPNDGYLTKLNAQEAGAGIQRGNVANYFPHVYNMPKDQSFEDVVTALQNMGPRGQQIIGGLKNASSGFQRAREEFKTMADLQDFLHAHHGTAVADKFANVSWNPLEAFGKRTIVGMNQVAKHEAVNEIHKAGLAIDHKFAPSGWRQVESLDPNSAIHQLNGQYVPPEIHKDLMSVNKLLTSSEDLNKFIDKIDNVMSVLRRNYTVTKLGFHTRQSIGNVFQNTLAGVSPSSYVQAAKFIANPGKYPQWEKELLENGIIHTGSSNADLAHNLGTELNTRLNAGNLASMLNPVGKNFALGKMGRKAGEYEDNVARAAHYFYMRNKGLSQQQAADSVRKYLFNYSEANNATRGIRMVIPFYQWMRNNLPFQMLNLTKNPKAYNIAQNFLKDFQNEPDQAQAMGAAGINNLLDQQTMQKVIQENGGILPKYIQDNYIDLGNGHYYNIGLPTQDLKQAVQDPATYFGSGLNPYLQLIQEMHSNQSSLNNAPIDSSVPTGQSIWTTPAGLNHVGETALGSPYQLLEGQLAKGLGTKTQNMDFTKQLQILASQKAKELSTRAKYLKKQNGGS